MDRITIHNMPEILRDEIAGKAMQCILTTLSTLTVDNDGTRHFNCPGPAYVAETAFDYADAMMAEREKRYFSKKPAKKAKAP